MWLDFIITPVNIRLSNTVSILRHISKSISGTHMHESAHRVFQTLEPCDTCGHWLSLANRYSAFGTTLLFQIFYELVAPIVVPMRCTLLWYTARPLALSNSTIYYRLCWLMARSKSYHFIPFTWSRDICIILHWWWWCHREICCDMLWFVATCS